MPPKASRHLRATLFTALILSPFSFYAITVEAHADRRPAVESLVDPEDFTDSIDPLQAFCSTDAECEELKVAQWKEYQSCLSVYNPETIIKEEEEECWRDGQAVCLKYSSDPECMDLDEV